MNNLVSVRIQNKYKTSFSLSHYLKHSHSTISKKVKAYCLVNNLDYKNLKYEQEYQIMLAPETFVQLAGVNPYSQPKSIRTLSRRSFVQNGL